MQWIATDEDGRLVPASRARRKASYVCRECGGEMRLRGGLRNQLHFYHLRQPLHCRQSQKSLVHLQVQYYLLGLLPEGECQLEKQFSKIGRIADVVWEPQGLIFEVQYSPISKEEVRQRNQDYSSLGYQVIWILHEKQFNHWRMRPAEGFLRGSPHYFTDFDSSGNGMIYDQVDVCHAGTRKVFHRIKKVNLAAVKQTVQEEVPKKFNAGVLRERLAAWPVHFEGDVIDLWQGANGDIQNSLHRAAEMEVSLYEKAAGPILGYLKRCLFSVFIRPYTLLFQILLEKSCR